MCVELAYPRMRGLARRYEGRGVSREDLEQEVALGVMRAIERYDPARGVPFVAWAHTWVRQALQQATAEQSRPFRLTRRKADFRLDKWSVGVSPDRGRESLDLGQRSSRLSGFDLRVHQGRVSRLVGRL